MSHFGLQCWGVKVKILIQAHLILRMRAPLNNCYCMILDVVAYLIVVFIQYLCRGNTQYFCSKKTESTINESVKSKEVCPLPPVHFFRHCSCLVLYSLLTASLKNTLTIGNPPTHPLEKKERNKEIRQFFVEIFFNFVVLFMKI